MSGESTAAVTVIRLEADERDFPSTLEAVTVAFTAKAIILTALLVWFRSSGELAQVLKVSVRYYCSGPRPVLTSWPGQDNRKTPSQHRRVADVRRSRYSIDIPREA